MQSVLVGHIVATFELILVGFDLFDSAFESFVIRYKGNLARCPVYFVLQAADYSQGS